MNRKTIVTHPDGTTSTRSSKTRFYEWAVEAKTNKHLVAGDRAKYVEKLRAESAAFAEAVADGKFIKKSKPWSTGGTYTDFYVVHPKTGEEFWLGAESRNANGELNTWDKGYDRAEAVTKHVEEYTVRIKRAQQEIEDLLAGPEITYSIARWSERRDSAEKALNSFQWAHTTFRVVKAEEVPAKAPRK